MTTLISFLGKGDPQKGYRTASYRFSAEDVAELFDEGQTLH